MPLDLDKKLATARTKLILEKPFLGALVLRLPMVRAKDDWCDATFSNGKKLYYNEHYIDALSADQTQFVLAHEALHCALSHFARQQNRVQHRWDMACDFAINPMLINDGMKPPVDANYLREYDGMTAEEIYPLLQDNDNDQERELEQNLNPDSDNEKDDDSGGTPDQHDQKEGRDQKQKSDSKGQNDDEGEEDGGARENNAGEDNSEQGDGQGKKQQGPPEEGEPDPLTPQEIESLSLQWQQRMASAAQQAIQAGKMGGSMARMVDHLLQPRLPWRMLLSRYMTMVARDDYTYMRPSSRRGDPAVYPSLRSAQLNIVVALDISGSISNSEINEFMSEVDSIKAQMRARITLLVCDSKLDGPWIFEPWDEFTMPKKFKGGGGTRFNPVIEWAEAQDEAPNLIVYFTDAQGEFPEQEPTFPVVWLVKGKTPVPWGQRVQLN